MASINLFRIDFDKKEQLTEALNDFNCIAQGTKLIENIKFDYQLYKSINDEKKKVSWEWIVKEFDEKLEMIDTSPSGLLVLDLKDRIYLLSFGHSFFFAERYCDKNFGFDFAKRIPYKEIKTTTIVVPNSKKNKMINTYSQYNELDYDSGESFVKIKAKINDIELLNIVNSVIEIGSSIKCKIKENKIESVIKLIIEVEKILNKEIINMIPLYNKVKDLSLIDELEVSLLQNIDLENFKISLSELDIIGAIEIFNTNCDEYELKLKRKKKRISQLNIDEIEKFIDENNISKNELLNITVTCFYQGYSYYKILHDCIDYIDDERKCLLCNGIWYMYNYDYIKLLNESIKKITCLYDKRYDFTDKIYNSYFEKNKKIDPNLSKNKFYKERAFNLLRQEKDGFKCLDRENTILDKHRLEKMDLYKEETMYAVKVGKSSSKLIYAVDQSLVSLKLYDKGDLQEMPKIQNVGIWLILDRKKHIEDKDGKPDLSQLEMLALKSRLVDWARTVLLSGKKPIIRINYTK